MTSTEERKNKPAGLFASEIAEIKTEAWTEENTKSFLARFQSYSDRSTSKIMKQHEDELLQLVTNQFQYIMKNGEIALAALKECLREHKDFKAFLDSLDLDKPVTTIDGKDEVTEADIRALVRMNSALQSIGDEIDLATQQRDAFLEFVDSYYPLAMNRYIRVLKVFTFYEAGKPSTLDWFKAGAEDSFSIGSSIATAGTAALPLALIKMLGKNIRGREKLFVERLEKGLSAVEMLFLLIENLQKIEDENRLARTIMRDHLDRFTTTLNVRLRLLYEQLFED
ncbi:MAG: hypothetical protein AAFO74_11030 [Pseudomonadota bacterium]